MLLSARKFFGIAMMFLIILFSTNCTTQIFGAKKARIAILATGGTIAGAAKSKNATVGYQSGVFQVKDLIDAVPGLSDIADVTGDQVANIDSQDMNEDIWFKLAKKIQELDSSDVDGIVITHGTDTMEETAYFLDLIVKTKKPVVLVGSMRPATAISADGPLNLYNAVEVAKDRASKGKGVMVVMNDTIFSARDVTKTNTFQVNTFAALNNGPIGYIQSGKVYFSKTSLKANTLKTPFSIKNIKSLPKVVILYGFAGITEDYVNAIASIKPQGIVIAGVGDGGLGTMMKKALKDLAQQGIVIVRSTRTGSGIVARNGDADDDGSGFVVSEDLNPQKSRVLLQLALTETKDPKKIQDMFYQF